MLAWPATVRKGTILPGTTICDVSPDWIVLSATNSLMSVSATSSCDPVLNREILVVFGITTRPAEYCHFGGCFLVKIV